jgi:hypothetical protein
MLSIYNIWGRRWKIPKESFKTKLIGRSMDHFIVWVLNLGLIFILGLQILMIVTPQKLYQILVDYMFLSIYLWMEFCRYLQLSDHILSNCSPKFIEKYCIHVRDDSPWYQKMHPNLSPRLNDFSFFYDHVGPSTFPMISSMSHVLANGSS